MVKRPMYESARAKYPGVVVWALARGASNNFDACAPFFPSRRDTIDVLCTWPSYERRAASPTRLALGYYTYKHTCTCTIPLFPCTLVVRVLRSCSLHPGGASTMLTRLLQLHRISSDSLLQAGKSNPPIHHSEGSIRY